MARPGGAPAASMRTMVLVDGEEYLVIREGDLLAIVTNGTK